MRYIELVKCIYSRNVDLSTATRDSFHCEKKNRHSLAVTAAVSDRNQFVIRLQLRICVSFREN